MRVLITGAAGKVGMATVAAAHAAGHEVVATDAMYRPGLPVRLHLADLTDSRSVYPLLEGCAAVLHVGNHSSSNAARPVQKVLIDNVAMNTNVFAAAAELGVDRVVYVSSIQAITGSTAGFARREDPSTAPALSYLPLDGEFPLNPGQNLYAQSKSFGEQSLRILTEYRPTVIAASIRFPFIVTDRGRRADWLEHRFRYDGSRFGREVGTYLYVDDAASLLVACLGLREPGYRVYFPVQVPGVAGMSPAEVAARFLPEMQVRRPLDAMGSLVDLERITRETGWTPAAAPVVIDLADGERRSG